MIRHSGLFIRMAENKTGGILKLQSLLRIHDPQCLALVLGLKRRLDDGFFLRMSISSVPQMITDGWTRGSHLGITI